MTIVPTGDATASAAILNGVKGDVVTVNARLDDGKPERTETEGVSTTMTTRISAAIQHSGLALPRAGVELHVSGGRKATRECELALACVAVAAAGLVPTTRLPQTMLIGALNGDGTLCWTDGTVAFCAARVESARRSRSCRARHCPTASRSPDCEC